MTPVVSGRDMRGRAGKMGASERSDPLSLALVPPANETTAQRQTRLHNERQAKQRSDEIDRLLKLGDAAYPGVRPTARGIETLRDKGGRVYKMVLLGQAGAGKTTVLKQMRLLYDPHAHASERAGWSQIVVLNLTASIRVLLQTMQRYHLDRAERKSLELARLESPSPSTSPASPLSPTGAHNAPDLRTEALEMGKGAHVGGLTLWDRYLPAVTELERRLRFELGAVSDEAPVNGMEADGVARPAAVRTKAGEKSPLLLRPGWQERLFTYARRSLFRSTRDPGQESDEEDSEAVRMLRNMQAEILSLWNDDARCRALRKRGVFLDGQSEAATPYFLDHYARLVGAGYAPSDEDILHSRVRTLGVTEDVFRIDRTLVYRIYDVGGSRSQRAAWIPFLDDVDSIIFLAPLSAFDQPLLEDPATNRLEDTFTLFEAIVSNPLLAKASVILFLNKIDLLEKKLRQGVLLSRYWPEYAGDNDFEAVWRWFRSRFRDTLRRHEDQAGNAAKRRLYVHTTVATSTRQIKAILMSVKDSILRENLRVTGLV